MINQNNCFHFYITEILAGKTDNYLHTFKRYLRMTMQELSTIANQFVLISNAITYCRIM